MDEPRWVAVAVIVLGVLLLAAAITYFVVPAQSLPLLMGRIPGSDVIRWKRGLAGLILAVVCLSVGLRQLRGGRQVRGGRSQNP